jgi:hypothetical protein
MIGLLLLAAAASPPPGEAMKAAQAADTTVMGTITLKPNPGDPPSNTLDKVNCADVVVTATDEAGQVVAKTPARAGAAKGECIYSLKVPQGKNVLIGLLDVKLPVTAMRKAGGGLDKGTQIDQHAPVGNNQGIIVGSGRAGQFDVFIKAAPPSLFKAAAFNGDNAHMVKIGEATGPVRRDLNATFMFRAANKASTETK